MQQPENQSAKPRLGRSQASTSTSDTGSEKAPPPSYDVAMAQRGEFDGVEVEKGELAHSSGLTTRHAPPAIREVRVGHRPTPLELGIAVRGPLQTHGDRPASPRLTAPQDLVPLIQVRPVQVRFVELVQVRFVQVVGLGLVQASLPGRQPPARPHLHSQ